eukprot:g1846.t1
MEGAEATDARSIILHEDKKYYPDAEEVYGDAEALVQMEDTQPLTEPIITPVQSKNFDLLEKKMPDTTFDFNFLAAMMDKPNLVRNICFLGALHHGKTTFMDLLRMMKHALQDRLKVVLVINGIDRLIMELKLPPTDAYHKLRYCIEDINETMEKLYDSVGTEVDDRVYFSPLRGNVLFSSAQFRHLDCILTDLWPVVFGVYFILSSRKRRPH